MNIKVLIMLIILLVASLSLYFSFGELGTPIYPIYDQPLKADKKKTEHLEINQLNSLDQIFNTNHNWIATLSAEKKFTLIATGDVGMGRSVNTRTLKHGDWKWPWLRTADFLKQADLTLINLEAPLIKDCPARDDGMIFCADARHIEGLRFAGIDIASTANNHYGNHGIEGIKESNDILSLNDIISIKNNSIKPITINSHSVIFLNYNEIGYRENDIDWADNEKIIKEVAYAAQIADLIIVSFHWGNEYSTEITKRQVELAHLAINSGADLIIGNHAHWIQPVEFYKGKLIMYAHGNFIFDQMWSQETREGVIGRYTFYDKQLVDVQYFPIQIEDFGQPHFLEETQNKKIIDNLYKISIDYQSQQNPVQ